MAHPPPPKDRDGFEIAIICATKVEADAVEATFDKVWDHKYGKAPGDTNAYTTGVIGDHNAVLAYMPGMGKGAAARVAGSFCSSFTRIQLALLVGICGGVPDGRGHNEKEVLLGDVVISDGILQYDFGRRWPGRFERKDTLNDNLGRPNLEIRGYLAKLRARAGTKKLRDNMMRYLALLLEEADFEESRYPGPDRDKLFRPAYRHKHHQSEGCVPCTDCNQGEDGICKDALRSPCSALGCDETKLIHRARLIKAQEALELPEPVIHYGRIASGDTLMRSGEDRDEIARNEEVIAFEMEGAGIWDSFPCVIIKGISDYADSHKSKEWQAYAAATAASCMKSFLVEWTSRAQTQLFASNEQQQPSQRAGPLKAALQSDRVRGVKWPYMSGQPERRDATKSCQGKDHVVNDESNSNPDREELSTPKLFNLGMFEIGRPLGRGRFGRVYLAKERNSGYICVLKVLHKNEIQQAKAWRQVRREIEIQSNLRHPNILPLLGHFHDSKRIFLILECASKGDLSMHLRRENRFPDRRAAQYIAQIAHALEYMHRKHVIHRDIKIENILLGVRGEIKISDFGSSVHAPAPTNRRHTFCGTLDYLSPEMIEAESQGTSYSQEVDLWALGVLLYEFLVGVPPFQDTQMMTLRRIAKGEMTVPDFVSPAATDVIRRLLVLDPEKRLSLEELRKHPWIVEHCSKQDPA